MEDLVAVGEGSGYAETMNDTAGTSYISDTYLSIAILVGSYEPLLVFMLS